MNRRALLHLGGLAASIPVLSRMANAQSYPSRPVRLVVGFPAGGPNDILGRIIAQWLSQRLGQPFVVENQPGNSGNIATAAVVRAPADGYALLLVGPANAIGASLYPNLPFNVLRDIAPVAGITREPLVMVVHPSVPAKSVAELIAYSKAEPGKLKLASTGQGSSPHVSAELFKMLTGLGLPVVHYAGGGPALKAMIEGQAQLMFEPMSASIEPVRSGKLRAGGDHRGPRSRATRRADAGRGRAGLRGECGHRHRRAARHARGRHRHAQRGDQRGLRRPRDAGAPCRHRRQRAGGLARGIRADPCGGDGEVGEGGEGVGGEGELSELDLRVNGRPCRTLRA
jgi:tripartite-type tricarboxylate transporter receptor subunit TctC